MKVDLGQKKGKIVVEFASMEDLDRILGSLAPGEGRVLDRGTAEKLTRSPLRAQTRADGLRQLHRRTGSVPGRNRTRPLLVPGCGFRLGGYDAIG